MNCAFMQAMCKGAHDGQGFRAMHVDLSTACSHLKCQHLLCGPSVEHSRLALHHKQHEDLVTAAAVTTGAMTVAQHCKVATTLHS